MDRLKYLLERKKNADSLPEETRIKFQAEYDAIVNEIELLTVPSGFHPVTTNENLQVKQTFNELSPAELTQSVYNRKITVNQYMDIVNAEQDENKKLKYLIDFYDKYLLVRFKKANEYIDQGNTLNSAEQQQYKMLKSLMSDCIEYFKSKGLNADEALE